MPFLFRSAFICIVTSLADLSIVILPNFFYILGSVTIKPIK